MSVRLLTVRIRQEQDVVAARQRARQLARLLGFDEQDQVRIATSISELARTSTTTPAKAKSSSRSRGRHHPRCWSRASAIGVPASPTSA